MMPIHAVTSLSLMLASLLGLALDRPTGLLPISAHNCYLSDSTRADRLIEALNLGIDNIEIDLGWDEANRRLIVGHDARPKPGVAYPEFEAYLVPALEAHWRKTQPGAPPTVLTIDWKTNHPDAVRRFASFLDKHPDWFTSAPKTLESPISSRRLMVCLTGDESAKDQYDALIPSGGVYRAFRDRVFGGGAYRTDVSEYAPAPASAYHRFLTFHWGVIEKGGPPLAGDWTEDEAERLASLLAQVHRQGFRARFYCLDGHTGPVVSAYRFRDDEAARVRWRAAAKAGADWIATDEYAEIVAALSARSGE